MLELLRGLFLSVLTIRVVDVIGGKPRVVRVGFELVPHVPAGCIRIFGVEAFHGVCSRANVEEGLAIPGPYLIGPFDLIYRLTSDKAVALDVIDFVGDYVVIIFYRDRNKRRYSLF